MGTSKNLQKSVTQPPPSILQCKPPSCHHVATKTSKSHIHSWQTRIKSWHLRTQLPHSSPRHRVALPPAFLEAEILLWMDEIIPNCRSETLVWDGYPVNTNSDNGFNYDFKVVRKDFANIHGGPFFSLGFVGAETTHFTACA